MPGAHLRFDITAERLLDDLTEAATRTALRQRTKRRSDGQLRVSLKRALKAVLRKDMQMSEQCGSHVIGICSHALRADLWPAKKTETP